MKHSDPKWGAGNHTMLFPGRLIYGIHLIRTTGLAEPCSGPFVARRANLGRFLPRNLDGLRR